MLARIKKIEAWRDDKRGPIFRFQAKGRSNILIIDRKKGTDSGRHYHRGNTKSKNPETFYLAKGEVKLMLRDIETGVEEEHLVKPHHTIEISPKIHHVFHAETDILLLEFNYPDEDPAADTVKDD